MRTISSKQNRLITTFKDTATRSNPDDDRILLEGVHLIREAQTAGISIHIVAVSKQQLETNSEVSILAQEFHTAGSDVVVASNQIMKLLSPAKTSQGIVAVATRSYDELKNLFNRQKKLIVIAANIQDPGNLGALLRTSEAGGATGVIVCGKSADPLTWKALRGSMGSALRLPMARLRTVEDAIQTTQKHGCSVVAAVPRGGKSPKEINWLKHKAVLFGGEGQGLPEQTVAHCNEKVTVPMSAPVESLNIAVAAGLIVYEASGQCL